MSASAQSSKYEPSIVESDISDEFSYASRISKAAFAQFNSKNNTKQKFLAKPVSKRGSKDPSSSHNNSILRTFTTAHLANQND